MGAGRFALEMSSVKASSETMLRLILRAVLARKAVEAYRTPRRFAMSWACGKPSGLGVRQSSGAFPTKWRGGRIADPLPGNR